MLNRIDSLDPHLPVPPLSWCTADVSTGVSSYQVPESGSRGHLDFIFLFLPTWDALVISMKDYAHVWWTSWHICGPHLCPCCSFSYSHMSSVYISQLQTGKFKARWARRRRRQRQPAGFTVWEANSNLSLRVYLQDATLHELRQRDRGRCASRGWHEPTSTFGLKNRELNFYFETSEESVQQCNTLLLLIWLLCRKSS